ncbi:MAG: metallophosphoesterase [Fimbriiglobus sp.]
MTPAPLPYPLIAVGDLHGQPVFLSRLVAKLRKLPEWPAARLVFVGDLVDRGPDVKGLVQLVLDLIAEKPGSTCVMGNHDLAFVGAAGLGGRRSEFWAKKWAGYDGHRDTFRSYLGREPEYQSAADWLADLDAVRDAMPAIHREFLANLPWVAEAAGHVFVHNGLSPDLDEPAEIQLELLRRKRWHGYVTPKIGTKTAAEIKPEYPAWLGADKRLSADPLPIPGKVQVTGHVRVPVPDANGVRIRLDTSGGTAEPLTGCLLRGPGEPPVFVFSDDGSD